MSFRALANENIEAHDLQRSVREERSSIPTLLGYWKFAKEFDTRSHVRLGGAESLSFSPSLENVWREVSLGERCA